MLSGREITILIIVMEKIRFCPDCGKVIDVVFRFCPYCGVAMKKQVPFSEVLDESFGKLEEIQDGLIDIRLYRLESKLDALEAEIEKFLSAPVGV